MVVWFASTFIYLIKSSENGRFRCVIKYLLLVWENSQLFTGSEAQDKYLSGHEEYLMRNKVTNT